MNSSIWSFRSSMKVASSVFFFLHEAMAGFFGTDGAEPSGWALLESILTLKQKQNKVNFHTRILAKKNLPEIIITRYIEAQNVISRMHTVTHLLFQGIKPHVITEQ